MRRILAFAAGFALLAVGLPNLIVWLGGRGPVTQDPARVPHAQAALVLGAQVMPNGAPSSMLSDRITAAEELYKAGRVDKLLLSGDHGRVKYDEVGSVVVVTQGFHMARALYDARRAGLDATGFVADRRDYGRVIASLRSSPAASGRPRGDGRASWGP